MGNPLQQQSNLLPGLGAAARHRRSKDELQGLMDLAYALVKDKRYKEAAGFYKTLTEALPGDRTLHCWLACLYHELGREEESQEVIRTFHEGNPVHWNNKRLKKGRHVLKFFGAEQSTYYVQRKSTGPSIGREGGHFTTEFLWDDSKTRVQRYYIVNDNISRRAPWTGYDLVLNTIADADVERKSLEALVPFANKLPTKKLINHPSKVLRTSRDANVENFNGLDGFRFPRTERLIVDGRSMAELVRDIESRSFSYPMIIRIPGTHTARSTELVYDRSALEAYLARETADEYYLIEFIDSSTAEGHFSKLRFFSIDQKLYPVVYHTDNVWNVHGGNRKTFMASHDWMMERERNFLEDPESVIGSKVMAQVERVPSIIGLDFFGFDFVPLDDGTVLLFEVNPAMRHAFDHAKNFPYMRPYMQNITDAFTRMIKKRSRVK